MRILKKGSNIQLTKNFNSKELDCKCEYTHCSMTLVNSHDLAALQCVRNDVGGSVHINSGYRCTAHNADLPKSSTTSSHCAGQGFDIKVPKGFCEYKFLEICRRYFGFTKLYIGAGFIHCDSKDRD